MQHHDNEWLETERAVNRVDLVMAAAALAATVATLALDVFEKGQVHDYERTGDNNVFMARNL